MLLTPQVKLLPNSKLTSLLTIASAPVQLWSFQDDGFFIWTGTRNMCLWWLSYFNLIFPRMPITYQLSQSEVDFMGIHIFKGNRFKSSGLLDFKVFQKPKNRYLYIPFHSFHTTASKRSFIHTELNRYSTHSSRADYYLDVKKLFYKRLRERGYPIKFPRPLFKKHSYIGRSQLMHSKVHQSNIKQQMIFKTQNNQRNSSLGLNNFLREVQAKAAMVPSLEQSANRRPILCLKRSNNLLNILRPM